MKLKFTALFMMAIFGLTAFAQTTGKVDLGTDLDQTDIHAKEMAISLKADVLQDDILLTINVDVTEIPSQGVFFKAGIPDDEGNIHNVFETSIHPTSKLAQRDEDTGRITFTQTQVIDRAEISNLLQGLAEAGMIDWDQVEVEKTASCPITNGSCDIYGTFNRRGFYLKAKATFDARSNCSWSMANGTYAKAMVEGSANYDYSYGDDYIYAYKSKYCGVDPDYCLDQGASEATFVVYLNGQGSPLVCSEYIPGL